MVRSISHFCSFPVCPFHSQSTFQVLRLCLLTQLLSLFALPCLCCCPVCPYHHLPPRVCKNSFAITLSLKTAGAHSFLWAWWEDPQHTSQALGLRASPLQLGLQHALHPSTFASPSLCCFLCLETFLHIFCLTPTCKPPLREALCSTPTRSNSPLQVLNGMFVPHRLLSYLGSIYGSFVNARLSTRLWCLLPIFSSQIPRIWGERWMVFVE